MSRGGPIVCRLEDLRTLAMAEYDGFGFVCLSDRFEVLNVLIPRIQEIAE